MNTFKLVLSYLKAKPFNTFLNVVLLALGVLIINVLLLFTNQLEESLTKNSKGIDLVVGAKGSPMQIILSSIFHVDFPTGNIRLTEVEKLTRNRNVKEVLPLALGDAYNNYRIVGTIPAYLDWYGAELAVGRRWNEEMEVVIGASVNTKLGLDVGDQFNGQHGVSGGYDHEGHGYKVVGVLEPQGSVIDQLIITSVPSVWEVHDEIHDQHDNVAIEKAKWSKVIPSVNLNSADSLKEITTALIKYRSSMAAMQLPGFINKKTTMQAASPAIEIARLFSIIGVGVEVFQGFAYLIVLVAMLSVFITLYNALRERQYDLAVMRAMGATKLRLLGSLLLEGTIITFLGLIVGITLSHVIIQFIVNYMMEGSVGISGAYWHTYELYLAIGILLIGIISALIPALGVYRVDVSKVLSEE